MSNKMKKIIFITLLSLFALNLKAELQAPKESSCEFYLSLEKTVPCGHAGYAKDFGYPYCEKFLKTKYYRFSKHGKDFLTKNALCLQEALYKGYSDHDPFTCKDIKSMAFGGHADCYINSGFCELSLSDKIILTNVIKDQLPSKIVRDQMKEVLKRCQNY